MFAEFLKPPSLARLSLLDQPTCVGLRYGKKSLSLRVFSGKLNLVELLCLAAKLLFAPQLSVLTDFPIKTVSMLKSGLHLLTRLFQLRQPPGNNETFSVQEYQPVIHPLRPRKGLMLGPDSPHVDERCVGNLGYSAVRILIGLSLLIPAFSLPCAPASLTG